jgi:hypothetical protein
VGDDLPPRIFERATGSVVHCRSHRDPQHDTVPACSPARRRILCRRANSSLRRVNSFSASHKSRRPLSHSSRVASAIAGMERLSTLGDL